MRLRSLLVLTVVAAVCLVLCSESRADFCVECDLVGGSWWCVGTGSGADRCRASADGNVCFVIGVCSSLPPPDPPAEDLAEGNEYFFELPLNADTSSLPAVLSNSEAYDVATIRQEIATRTGVAAADVLLRNGMFSVGSVPVNWGREATAIGNRGSLYRIDVLGDESLRTKICIGDAGKTPGLLADVTLGSDGGVVLVGTTINGDKAVVAHRITRVAGDDFAADPYTSQQTFRDDLEANITPSFSYATGPATMSGECN